MTVGGKIVFLGTFAYRNNESSGVDIVVAESSHSNFLSLQHEKHVQQEKDKN